MSTTTYAGPTGTEGPDDRDDRDDSNAPDAQVIELRKPGTDQRTGPDAGPDAVPSGGGDETAESAESHYDVTLDEEPTPGGDPVDIAVGPAGSQPIIPSALHGWANIKATVRHAAALTAYRAGFHAVRSPWYGVQALWWSLVGLFRGAGRVLRWWWLAEQTGLRQAAADANDPQVWFKLHREVKATRAWRFVILAAAVIAAAILLPLAYSLAPWWVTAPVVGLAVAGLARIGRPVDRPIIGTATVTQRLRRINADIVLRAYYAAGLGNPDKPNLQVGFGSPMSRDASGTGSHVLIDLPYGKGWDDVVKSKGAIASGLDVSINQVFLTKDDTSNRRHNLFVADRDPLAIPAGRTPLLDCKVRDIWTEAPLGLDERGGKVGLLLLWISILVGAQPRKGKTFFARLLALFAALDPFVTMVVVDGKMSADWDKFRLIAHRYVCGIVPNSRDDDPITHFLEMLREVKAHIQEVNDILAGLPTTECPEGKLTRALARSNPKLRVWMLVLEEFQNYYETDDQDINKEIAGLLSYIQAVGPSAGVILVSSSQKPGGIGSGDVSRLFTRFRDNHAVRFALRCGNRNVSEAVLGGDAYAEGFDASALPKGKKYLGVGILYGASDDTPVVRSHLADHGDAEKILLAARRHRLAAGTLTGYAAGEVTARETRDALADVRGVFAAGEKGLHWPTIAARLAEVHPEHYADITAEAISAQLRKHVRSVDIKVAGEVRKGARLADIDAAMKARTPG